MEEHNMSTGNMSSRQTDGRAGQASGNDEFVFANFQKAISV
jgi:hypothetical protein